MTVGGHAQGALPQIPTQGAAVGGGDKLMKWQVQHVVPIAAKERQRRRVRMHNQSTGPHFNVGDRMTVQVAFAGALHVQLAAQGVDLLLQESKLVVSAVENDFG